MADVKLRPVSLRPGGGAGSNPFAQFGKGAASKSAAVKQQASLSFYEERPKKPDSEIIRYSRDFLLQFSLKMQDTPANLNPAQSECIINREDPNQAGAQEALQSVIPAPDDADDRNWRTRTELPPQEGGAPKERELIRGPAPQQGQGGGGGGSGGSSGNQQQPRPASAPFGDAKATNGPAGGAAGSGGATSQLQSAADVGKKAWMPGTTSKEGDAAALKAVKGILNKLTPEKFDRLLGQLIEQVKSVDVLNGLISLVFENAVEQPTFVAMYAQLGQALAEQLPELAPPKGQSKPMSFQKLLLNTCQDQFESTTDARAALTKLSGFERDSQERRVKQRTIGTIRLIAELYKKSVVREPVVHACIQELLGAPTAKPIEDNIEALCEMVTIAGKKLEETSKVPAKVEGYFKAMEKLGANTVLAPRIRFLVRDVLDLRRMKWVPRRETLKAKKLDEIHAEAHAELGMMPALANLSLPPLPGLKQLTPGKAAEEEIELFPAFAGAEDGGWQKLISGGAGGGGKGSSSALLGDYAPVAQQPAAPAAAAPAGSNATPPQTSAAPQYIKGLSQEDREKRADGMFSEFLGSADEKEAVLCCHELSAPGFPPVLVQRGVLKMLDCLTERDQQVLSDLLVKLPGLGGYKAEDLQEGINLVTKEMEDIMMDAPKAPKLCGGVIGRALLHGILPPSAILELSKPIEGGEVRRALFAPALQYIKEKGGEDKLKELTQDIKGSDFLELDAELDPPDLPSVADFLKAEGLAAIAA